MYPHYHNMTVIMNNIVIIVGNNNILWATTITFTPTLNPLKPTGTCTMFTTTHIHYLINHCSMQLILDITTLIRASNISNTCAPFVNNQHNDWTKKSIQYFDHKLQMDRWVQIPSRITKQGTQQNLAQVIEHAQCFHQPQTRVNMISM